MEPVRSPISPFSPSAPSNSQPMTPDQDGRAAFAVLGIIAVAVAACLKRAGVFDAPPAPKPKEESALSHFGRVVAFVSVGAGMALLTAGSLVLYGAVVIAVALYAAGFLLKYLTIDTLIATGVVLSAYNAILLTQSGGK